MKTRVLPAILMLSLCTGVLPFTGAMPCTDVLAAETPTSPLFVVHFETGPKWNKSLPPGEQPTFADHSANMSRLRKEGVIAFGARYAEVGMIVVKAATLDAARAHIEADPGVKSGLFVYRIAPLKVFYPWQE